MDDELFWGAHPRYAQVVDGYMTVPEEPGLGVEINEEILSRAE